MLQLTNTINFRTFFLQLLPRRHFHIKQLLKYIVFRLCQNSWAEAKVWEKEKEGPKSSKMFHFNLLYF